MAAMPVSVDANAVIDELTKQMASVIRENAILKVRLDSQPSHDIQPAPAT